MEWARKLSWPDNQLDLILLLIALSFYFISIVAPFRCSVSAEMRGSCPLHATGVTLHLGSIMFKGKVSVVAGITADYSQVVCCSPPLSDGKLWTQEPRQSEFLAGPTCYTYDTFFFFPYLFSLSHLHGGWNFTNNAASGQHPSFSSLVARKDMDNRLPIIRYASCARAANIATPTLLPPTSPCLLSWFMPRPSIKIIDSN